jgi:hypothetical protein
MGHQGKGEFYVRGDDDYGSLDTHAEWSVVLELFLWLRKIDPRIVLADLSAGNFHDPQSFRKFMKEIQSG